MFACRDVISAGDVVARLGHHFVVVRSDGDRLGLVPVVAPGASTHRADVRPSEPGEFDAGGLGDRDVIVACRFRASMPRAGGFAKLGTMPPAVMRRIALAMSRERATHALEIGTGLGSNLLAQTFSSGRRIGAVRYT